VSMPSDRYVPDLRDAIRIVPLSLTQDQRAPVPGIPAAPTAQMTYRGGPLLSSVDVFALYWGAGWQGAQAALTQQIDQFFDFVVTSALIDQLSEYSVSGQTIGHGRRSGSTVVTTPAPASSITDAGVRSFLQQQIAAGGAVPGPTPNRLYFVFLPPGVTVALGGSSSCMAFCGYHDNINAQIFYAVMPFPGCNGCLGGLQTLESLTTVSSHELCEAITDAVPGQGWYDDNQGEIGDVCPWQTKKLGAYTVQLEWSNQAAACR
jgi:hypothetical protein